MESWARAHCSFLVKKLADNQVKSYTCCLREHKKGRSVLRRLVEGRSEDPT